jgi:Flp pilus assembly protein TadD
MPRFMLLVLASCLPVSLGAQTFDLRFDRLTSALATLSAGDRTAVDQAIELMRKGDNNLALVRLSALNEKNPQNSSLRILTAYSMLRLGNLVGAFDEAGRAEKAQNGDSYKCWFLAKLAFLKGDMTACRREIDHAKANGEDVKALEDDMKKRKGS